MLITVTQAMIDEGRNKLPRCMNCPVALAINTVLGPKLFSDVNAVVVRIFETVSCEMIKQVPLPKNVGNWIEAFDDKQNVSPISFELPLENL